MEGECRARWGVAVVNALVLSGCRTEPLGSYLKALGILRIIGAQADTRARGHWHGDTFVLTTDLSNESLAEFFLDIYRPTPVISPWNKGSGFAKEGKSPGAVAAVGVIEASSDERLAAYRAAITIGEQIYADMVANDWEKSATVKACRERLPDLALPWIDASVVLAQTKEIYPPMLGTGGNDGRLDFSVAYMGRVADILGLKKKQKTPARPQSAEWLAAALFETPTALVAESTGQFSPGATGGANSGPVVPAPSLVNPWDWVLLIEGSMVFVSAAARRMGSDAGGRAAIPFTSDSSPTGYGSSATEGSRGEIWAPVWCNASSAAEVGRFIEEGRMTWKGKQGRSGVDFARAAASLGADRGISGFVRHALLERNGLSTTAVPVGFVTVKERPQVALTGDLDRWLQRIRRAKNAPASIEGGIAAVQRCLFDVARQGDSKAMQGLLYEVAGLEHLAGRARRFRADADIRPVAGLAAVDWLPAIDDGTAEFQIAAAFATLRDSDGTGLREIVCPISRKGGSPEWSIAPEPVPGLTTAPIVCVFAAALVRRTVIVASRDRQGGTRGVGVQPAFSYGLSAARGSITRFLASDLDEDRLGSLFRSLLLLDWRSTDSYKSSPVEEEFEITPPVWALLAPFFHGRPIEMPSGTELTLRAEGSWPGMLRSDHIAEVVDAALRRYRVARIFPVFDRGVAQRISKNAPSGDHLAAALLLRSAPRSISRLVQQSSYQLQ